MNGVVTNLVAPVRYGGRDYRGEQVQLAAFPGYKIEITHNDAPPDGRSWTATKEVDALIDQQPNGPLRRMANTAVSIERSTSPQAAALPPRREQTNAARSP